MNTCSCGRPLNAGHTAGNGRTRKDQCLICATAKLMQSHRYPASYEGQRAWRKKEHKP